MLDREQVRCLLATYNINGDGGRIDLQTEPFADDGILEFEDMSTHGPAVIGERLSLPAGDGHAAPARVMRHHLGSSLVMTDGADAALAPTYSTLLNDIELDHRGMYVDRIVRTRGDGGSPTARCESTDRRRDR